MLDSTENPEERPKRPQKKRLYFLDEWLPAGRVHVIAGPSDVGKTTLLFDIVNAWMERRAWLGRQTHGQDLGGFYYIIGDRGADEAEETMERLDADQRIQYKAIDSPDAEIEDFYQCPPNTRILAIDAAERLVENGKLIAFKAVQDMLLRAKEIAVKHNMAIILMAGSPKLKKNEQHLHGREMISGSGAWGRFASTVFNLQYVDSTDLANSHRTLQVYAKNFKPQQFALQIGANGFELPVPAEELEFRVQLLNAMTPGNWYERRSLLMVAEANQVSASTLDRTLRELSRKGTLNKEHGRYCQPIIQIKLPQMPQAQPILISAEPLPQSQPEP